MNTAKLLLLAGTMFFLSSDNAYSGNTTDNFSAMNAATAMTQIRDMRNASANVPAASRPEAADSQKVSGSGAVILSVPGIVASSLWNYIFSKTDEKGLPDGEIALNSNDEKWLKEHFGIQSDEDYKAFKEQLLRQINKESRKEDDMHELEAAIRDMPGFNAKTFHVKTFQWTRNAKDSEIAAANLMDEIQALSDKAALEGKPFYILSHSWGTVLSHTALHRLYRLRRNINISTWITAGSPLVPSNDIVAKFVQHNVSLGNLERNVSKPQNVKRWVNVWAERDIISNKIMQCPINYQVDKPAEYYENLIKDKTLQIIDWTKLKNPVEWHCSYHAGFSAYLSTIKVQADIPIFVPYIQPELLR